MEERPEEGTEAAAEQPSLEPTSEESAPPAQEEVPDAPAEEPSAPADEEAPVAPAGGDAPAETPPADEAAADTPHAEEAPAELTPTRQAVTPNIREDLDSLVPPVFREKYEVAMEEEERAAAEAAARAEEEARRAEEERLAEEARRAEEEARAAEEAAAAAEAGDEDGAEEGEGETTPTALGDDVAVAPARKRAVPWWPFLIYLVAWIALIAAAALTISYETDALPAFEQEYYPYILLGGLVLTIAGPLLSILVWIVVRYRTPKAERSGIFAASLIKGASVTVFGVIAWWGALVVLDALRLGMISGVS
jgi:hypothetical protein